MRLRLGLGHRPRPARASPAASPWSDRRAIGDALIRQRHADGARHRRDRRRLLHVGSRRRLAGRALRRRGTRPRRSRRPRPRDAHDRRRRSSGGRAGHGPQPIHDLVVTAGGAGPAAGRSRSATSASSPSPTPSAAASSSASTAATSSPAAPTGSRPTPSPAASPTTKTRALLQSAADANMNMIRVWGGGRYEPASFYEACDALGLLVWQDFMFACHLYPATDAFLAEVAREVAFQARRLGHHVALWCGDNELLGALNWFEESRQNRDRYLVAYDRLNRTIETALKRTDPDANWWPSSPSPGPMSLRRRLARRHLRRHALLVGLARGPRLRALPRRPPPLLLRVRLPVLHLAPRDPHLRRRGRPQHRLPGDGEPPEERRRQRPHRRDDVPLLPLPQGLPQLRLALPGPAGRRDQDRRRLLALASSRTAWARSTGSSTTPGRSPPGRASTTAAAGSSCTTWRAASSSR